jgi:predicted phage tail protein
MKPQQVLVEARAKIIWGEPMQSVYEYLTTNGFSNAEAEETIAEFSRERNRAIRRRGIFKILLGIVLSVVAAFFVTLIFGSEKGARARRAATVGGFCALVGMYGLWTLIDGIFCLVRPKSEKFDPSE